MVSCEGAVALEILRDCSAYAALLLVRLCLAARKRALFREIRRVGRVKCAKKGL